MFIPQQISQLCGTDATKNAEIPQASSRRIFLQWMAAATLICSTSGVVAEDAEWEPSFQTVGFAPQNLATLHEDGTYSIPFTEKTAEHLVGTYKQLLANRITTPINKLLDGSGAFVRGKIDVDFCPRVEHAEDRLASFHQPWKAHAILTYAFMLKAKNEISVELDQGLAESVDGVATSKIVRKLELNFDWDPERGTLLIGIEDFDNPLDFGPQYTSGNYLVKGRSVGTWKVDSTVIDSNFDKDGFKLGVTTETTSGKRRLKVFVDGESYQAEFGVVSAVLSNFGTDFELIFGAQWISNTDTGYHETIAVVTEVECTSKRKVSFEFKKKDSIGGSYDTSGSKCGVSADQLPVRVRWAALPTLDLNTDELEGLFCQLRLHSRLRGPERAESWTTFRMGTQMNWYLECAAIGGAPGGGILVDNRGTRPVQTKKFNLREF